MLGGGGFCLYSAIYARVGDRDACVTTTSAKHRPSPLPPSIHRPNNTNDRGYRHNERAKQLLRTEVAVMSRIRKLHHPNLMSFKHTFEVRAARAQA